MLVDALPGNEMYAVEAACDIYDSIIVNKDTPLDLDAKIKTFRQTYISDLKSTH